MVKSNLAGRQAINDQIVARLGRSLGAAVGEPAFVRVSQDFIDLNPEIKNLGVLPGTWHAVAYVENYSEREGVQHISLPENQRRFSSLAVLYGWAFTYQDHQFIYSNDFPHLVLSVDHGHFFPGGPDWSIASLSGMTSQATPDPYIQLHCQLADGMIGTAKERLRVLDGTAVIADAVAAPFDEWQIALPERVAMAEFLDRRRAELLT